MAAGKQGDGEALETLSSARTMEAGNEVDAVTLPHRPRLASQSSSMSGATAVLTAESSKPPLVDVARAPLEEPSFAARYDVRAVLGEGGMGEVRLVRDRRVGRDVAMKVIRPGAGSRSDLRMRFEREARVQGQLEHPAVVPVYDLGVGPDGAAFFTMKRIRGHGFDEIVEGLRSGEPSFVSQYSLRRLLTAFSNVALAIAFAHARGVLHRDLKPANVMLGDFGEVYLLDWGLAKVFGGQGAVDLGEPDGDDLAAISTRDRAANLEPTRAGVTATGAIMGTPGYMAPEQVRGEIDRLDARADVYALGAILFELLALEPLHRRQSAEAILLSTLTCVEARPSVRAPDRAIPPELDAICARATALEPGDRYPTARAMVDDVERFLDGHRDTERRRELVETHVLAAQRALEHASSASGPAVHPARVTAIRELNRALALDPTHADALRTMFRLLVDAPKDPPPEAEAELQESIARSRRTGERVGAYAYLAWFALMPIFCFMGVRSWGALAFCATFVAIAAGMSWWLGGTQISDLRWGVPIYIASVIGLGASSMLFGPFILVPGMVAANSLFFSMYIERGRARRWIVCAGTLALLVPLAFELLGWLPPSIGFSDGIIQIMPRLTGFPPTATLVFLVAANVALIVVPSLIMSRVRDEGRAAERRVFLQLWTLRQFIPDEARGATTIEDDTTSIGHCDVRAVLGRSKASPQS